jgi:hypothetical protein
MAQLQTAFYLSVFHMHTAAWQEAKNWHQELCFTIPSSCLRIRLKCETRDLAADVIVIQNCQPERMYIARQGIARKGKRKPSIYQTRRFDPSKCALG